MGKKGSDPGRGLYDSEMQGQSWLPARCYVRAALSDSRYIVPFPGTAGPNLPAEGSGLPGCCILLNSNLLVKRKSC